MRRVLPLALAILVLAGCVDPHRAERAAHMAAFIGMSETDLIRELGVPTRTVDSNGHRFLAYRRSRLDIVPGSPFMPYGVYGWPAAGYGGGFPPQVVERGCETTFELVDGRVVHWSQRGNSC